MHRHVYMNPLRLSWCSEYNKRLTSSSLASKLMLMIHWLVIERLFHSPLCTPNTCSSIIYHPLRHEQVAQNSKYGRHGGVRGGKRGHVGGWEAKSDLYLLCVTIKDVGVPIERQQSSNFHLPAQLLLSFVATTGPSFVFTLQHCYK